MAVVRILNVESVVRSSQELAEAAALGVAECVAEHLRKKNLTTKPSRFGMPKTNYYGEASEAVRTETRGTKTAEVSVDYPGIALHYEGGTVRPKKKALAIPVSPSVAGIWPSEAGALSTGDGTALVWPKNSDHGFIKDNASGELLWLLVPKATIPADPGVLPTDGEMLDAAEDYVREAAS
jgi:hypothetical protein